MRLRRQRPTADDIQSLTSAMQQDLRAASAKLVELRAHLARLELPATADAPISEKALRTLVANTRHEYTEQSLRAELAELGASTALINELMEDSKHGDHGADELTSARVKPIEGDRDEAA